MGPNGQVDKSHRGIGSMVDTVRSGVLGTTNVDFDKLDGYEYMSLSDQERDIRLVELLPGQFNDDIRIRIRHKRLIEPETLPNTRLSLKQLRETIPEDMSARWAVKETLDGRFFFTESDERGGLRLVTWKHPVTGFDPERYKQPDQPLHGSPRYEALSYVWGTEGVANFVAVEPSAERATERAGTTKIAIRSNLEGALRQLRLIDTTRILWIDALCINQSDNAEKGILVQRMASIFKLAYRVVGWLGPETRDSGVAIEALRYIGQQIVLNTSNSMFPAPDATEIQWNQAQFVIPYSRDTWDAVATLLQRPYFRRLWIVQELALSNKQAVIQCGNDTVEVTAARSAVECLLSKTNQPTNTLAKAVYLVERVLAFRLYDTFNNLLLAIRNSACKDPRDKVYGLLGLVGPRMRSRICPSYDGNVVDVYKAAILAHAKESQRLELFKYIEDVSRTFSAPSWVPDLSEWGPGGYMPDQLAAGISKAIFRYQEPHILHVTGKLCGIVVNAIQSPTNDWHGICTVVHHQSTLSCRSRLGHNRREEYALAAAGGQVQERWPRFSYMYAPLTEWIQDMEACTQSCYETTLPNMVADAVALCLERSFIETEVGCVGLAPCSAKPGDQIVVFLGSPSPVLLRPLPNGAFTLLGECYFPCLADANALLGALPGQWRVIGDWGVASRFTYSFQKSDAGEETIEDPRLPSLADSPWERIGREPTPDDPEVYDFFRHRETGEIMNSDPRLLPEALEAMGVDLRNFALV